MVTTPPVPRRPPQVLSGFAVCLQCQAASVVLTSGPVSAVRFVYSRAKLPLTMGRRCVGGLPQYILVRTNCLDSFL